MEKEIIFTENAPKAIGPYSQAIKAGNMLFVSGQIPFDPKTMTVVEGDIKAQTNQVMLNLKAILTKAGFNLSDVVKTTIFIKDMNDFAQINEVYGQYFTDHKPARATVEVARLPKDVKVEIELTAMK